MPPPAAAEALATPPGRAQEDCPRIPWRRRQRCWCQRRCSPMSPCSSWTASDRRPGCWTAAFSRRWLNHLDPSTGKLIVRARTINENSRRLLARSLLSVPRHPEEWTSSFQPGDPPNCSPVRPTPFWAKSARTTSTRLYSTVADLFDGETIDSKRLQTEVRQTYETVDKQQNYLRQLVCSWRMTAQTSPTYFAG